MKFNAPFNSVKHVENEFKSNITLCFCPMYAKCFYTAEYKLPANKIQFLFCKISLIQLCMAMFILQGQQEQKSILIFLKSLNEYVVIKDTHLIVLKLVKKITIKSTQCIEKDIPG